MKKAEWVNGLLISIAEFADLNYQYREWVCFETNPYASFEESMCMLYDGAHFEEILNISDQFNFSKEQLTKLKEFNYALTDYADNYMTEAPETVKDPNWHKVVQKAQEVLEAFKDYKVLENTELDFKLF